MDGSAKLTFTSKQKDIALACSKVRGLLGAKSFVDANVSAGKELSIGK